MRLKEFLTDAISHKRTEAEINDYMKRIKQLQASGSTFDAAATRALADMKRRSKK